MADFERLRFLASRQHGLVSRQQTRSAGYDRFALARLVDKGYLTWSSPESSVAGIRPPPGSIT